MKKTNHIQHEADESAISVAAAQLWEQAGKPPGRDLEFWLRAKEQVRNAQPEKARAIKPAAKVRSPVAPGSAKVTAGASTARKWFGKF